jgi:hypothetical protein
MGPVVTGVMDALVGRVRGRARGDGRPGLARLSPGESYEATPSGAVTTSWWAPAPASCSRRCSRRTCAIGVNHHTPADQAGSTSATAGWSQSRRLTSSSSSTPVAPPSGHLRPPSTSRTQAPLLCQRVKWPDPTPRSPPGRSTPGTAAAERTRRCGARLQPARRCSRPASRGGGTPAATGRGYGAGRRTGASVRGWEAHKGRGQADQAAGVAARLLPVAAFAAPTWAAAKRLPWS